MEIQFTPFDGGNQTGPVEDADALLNLEITQPKPIGKELPDWWRALPAFEENKIAHGWQTAKSCRPLHDYMHYGYILPLWCDYMFEYNQKTNEIMAASRYVHADHPSGQTGHVLERSDGFQGTAIKFLNPWMITTPPGYSCLFTAPFYHFEERFTIAPAIVNTDLYKGQVHFPAFVKKHIRVPFILEMGYPLIHIIPFKRDDWKSKLTSYADLLKTKTFRSFRYLIRNNYFWQYKKFASTTNKFK